MIGNSDRQSAVILSNNKIGHFSVSINGGKLRIENPRTNGETWREYEPMMKWAYARLPGLSR